MNGTDRNIGRGGLALLLLATILIGGCTMEYTSVPDSSIFGTIRRFDGTPLAGAYVYTLPNRTGVSAVTDSWGNYELYEVPSGTYVIVASYLPNASLIHTDYIDHNRRYDTEVNIEGNFSLSFDITNGNFLLAASNINTGGSYPTGIYLFDPGGWQEIFPVVNDGSWEYQSPDMSPVLDGEIIFAAGPPGNTSIYRFDMFTGALIRLTDRHGHDSHPRYSPDGEYFVYVRETSDGSLQGARELWRARVRDGTQATRIVSAQAPGGTIWDNSQPAWTPASLGSWTGASIVFSTRRLAPSENPNWQLAVAPASGQSDPYLLTDGSFDAHSPTVHPDSLHEDDFTIVFVAPDDWGWSRLHAIWPEGDNIVIDEIDLEYTRFDGVRWFDAHDFEPRFRRTAPDGARPVLTWVSTLEDSYGFYGDQLFTAEDYWYGSLATGPDYLDGIMQWTDGWSDDLFLDPAFPGF